MDDTPWRPAMLYALCQTPEGIYSLTGQHARPHKRLPKAWHSFLAAWYKLNPHWQMDMTQWSWLDIMSHILPGTATPHAPIGIPVGQVLNTSRPARPLVTQAQLTTWFGADGRRIFRRRKQVLDTPGSIFHVVLTQALSVPRDSPAPGSVTCR